MESITYNNGKKAAEMNMELKDTELFSLPPKSEQYSDFLNGYMSSYVSQDAIDCACDELGSICSVCEDDY